MMGGGSSFQQPINFEFKFSASHLPSVVSLKSLYNLENRGTVVAPGFSLACRPEGRRYICKPI